MDLRFFPDELKARPQWMVAGAGDPASPDYKRPISVKTGGWGSPTNPAHWCTFEEALASPYPLKGYVFDQSDPFAVIDLDTYKAKSDEVRSLHAEILRHATTYHETSQSGLGTHIICRGAVAEGAHNEPNAIEIYSHARFMICTGKAEQVFAVTDQQSLLDYLYPLVKGTGGSVNWRDLDSGEDEEMTDAELVERASYAENGDKFIRLCRGEMSDYGNDHSVADMALIQFLCFWSKNNDQVARIFHMSPLGQREKAFRKDYVPRTIAKARMMLAKDQPPPVNADAVIERAKAITQQAQTPAVPAPAPVDSAPQPAPAMIAPATPLAFPVGIVGEVAQYILASSTRPVPEAALAGAIAVVAGIVGRNYNISTPATGLNMYLLYLAKTGTGKEAIQSGIDRLFAEVHKTIPASERFLGPAAFSSGPALVKRFAEQPCFSSILGEFGLLLKQMLNPRANGAEKTLMRAMLDLYSKSGWGQTLRSSVYSDKEKNTTAVHAPALTLLGETAPESFFAGLDEAAIENGFLPRFLVIEYTGERPRRNRQAWMTPPPDLVQRVTDLCSTVLQMEQNNTCVTVGIDAAAQALLDEFDEWVDDRMRGSTETIRHLWNRAHLKALRLAGLIAVGVNPYSPTVTATEAQWAINMVRADVTTLHDRFISGDVGEGDSKQRADVERVITKFFATPPKGWYAYAGKGCIPTRYLVQAVSNRSCFKNDRRGSTRALKEMLAHMVEAGQLQLVPKQQAQQWFKTNGQVFALGDMWATE